MFNLIRYIRNNLFIYIIISIIVIISNDTFWFGTSGIDVLLNIKYIFIIAVIPLFFLIQKKPYKNINIYPIIGLAVFLSFISSLINGSEIFGGSMLLIVLIISAVLVCETISFEKFAIAFVDLMVVAIFYSCVIWLLMLLKVVPYNMYVNSQGTVLFGFAQNLCFIQDGIVRNTFIFREPGLYMIYINIAFLFEIIFRSNNLKSSHLFIYFIGILSTFSTAGYLIFGLLLVMYFKKTRLTLSKIFLFIFFLLGCTIIALSSQIQDVVWGKLYGFGVNARVSSITVSTSILFDSIQNFLFGVGTSSLHSVYASHSHTIYGVASSTEGLLTNTFFNSAATFGIWIFFYFLFGFLLLAKRITAGPFTFFFSLIVLLLMFSNQAMYYSLFLNLLVLYGYNYKSTFKYC